MLKGIKHLSLIITLAAWIVFPLPECYLTKPDCPRRNNVFACGLMDHQRAPVRENGTRPCCARALPRGRNGVPAGPRAANQDGGRTRMAVLSPRFLLPDSPDLTGPAVSPGSLSPVSASPLPAPTFCSPYRGERVEPVPIHLLTQTFLI